MAETNHHVLSIAGFDPSGGAGILADIKTFEANGVQGMGVLSALTFQNESLFESLKWIETSEILRQIGILTPKYTFPVIKIGLIRDLETLKIIIDVIGRIQPGCRIVWDPVIKASAGFAFHQCFEREQLLPVLEKCFLVTPNIYEATFLTGAKDYMEAAVELSKYCNILLKGGHNTKEKGDDYLFVKDNTTTIHPVRDDVFPKHGSGCVLSSAIVAGLAKGNSLEAACLKAKEYTEHFLSSSQTLLGAHYAQ